MTLRQFIKDNREEIDSAIDYAVGHVPSTASCCCPKSGTNHTHTAPRRNDSERRQWIENSESLYNWARGEGVRI